MITVTVLLEKTAISRDFQKRHGLSLAIARDVETLLLDDRTHFLCHTV